MILDSGQVRSGLRRIHSELSPDEARVIFDVARLAAAADHRTDVSEMAVLLNLAPIVFEMANERKLPAPGGAVDASILHGLGARLATPGARELAFACAFLVMFHDGALADEERLLADNLCYALPLSGDRARQLALDVEAIVQTAARR